MKRTNKRAIHESESNTGRESECVSHGLFCATFTVPINKLKNAYFKFKSTNRQRNEMSNIIVVWSTTTTKTGQDKKQVGVHRKTDRERKSQRKRKKNHFIWLEKSVVERKLFRITCGKMELQRRKQTVCVCVERRDSLVCCCCCHWTVVWASGQQYFVPYVSFVLVQRILFTVTREHATQTVWFIYLFSIKSNKKSQKHTESIITEWTRAPW